MDVWTDTTDVIETILLVGITGSGKSTVGNVLRNIAPGDDESFAESDGASAETKGFAEGYFTGDDGSIYRIIDTVGLFDTELDPSEVYRQLSQAIGACAQTGIAQVLFVTSGRVTQEQLTTFRTITDILLDSDVTKYLTFVRTNFARFRDQAACMQDINDIHTNHPAFSAILREAEGRLVHVNNQVLAENEGWQESRAHSRSKLMTAITNNLQAEPYLPPPLLTIQGQIEEDRVLQYRLRHAQEQLPVMEAELNAALQQGRIQQEAHDQQLNEIRRHHDDNMIELARRIEEQAVAHRLTISELQEGLEKAQGRRRGSSCSIL